MSQLTNIVLLCFITFVFSQTPTLSVIQNALLETNQPEAAFQIYVDQVRGVRYLVGYAQTNITAYTGPSIDPINKGDNDVLIVKFDIKTQDIIWKTLIGSKDSDVGIGITGDQAGNIYVNGYTFGNLGGNINNGRPDIFVMKVSSHGNVIWTKVIRTNYDDAPVAAKSIVYDPLTDSVFTTGYVNASVITSQAILAQLAATDGNLLQSIVISGNSSSYGYSLALFGNRVTVVGLTCASDFSVTANAQQTNKTGDCDAFIRTYTFNSNMTSLLYSSYFNPDNRSGTALRSLSVDNLGNYYAVYGVNFDDFLIYKFDGSTYAPLWYTPGGNTAEYIAPFKIVASNSVKTNVDLFDANTGALVTSINLFDFTGSSLSINSFSYHLNSSTNVLLYPATSVEGIKQPIGYQYTNSTGGVRNANIEVITILASISAVQTTSRLTTSNPS